VWGRLRHTSFCTLVMFPDQFACITYHSILACRLSCANGVHTRRPAGAATSKSSLSTQSTRSDTHIHTYRMSRKRPAVKPASEEKEEEEEEDKEIYHLHWGEVTILGSCQCSLTLTHVAPLLCHQQHSELLTYTQHKVFWFLEARR
jgi:hypothetical protein